MTFIAAVSAIAGSAIAGSATASGAASKTSPDDVQAGVLGFLVVAAIGVVLVFLLRSMNKQFKKLGPKPEDPADTLAEQAGAGPAGAGHVVVGEVVAEPGPDAGPARAKQEGNVTDSPSR